MYAFSVFNFHLVYTAVSKGKPNIFFFKKTNLLVNLILKSIEFDKQIAVNNDICLKMTLFEQIMS